LSALRERLDALSDAQPFDTSWALTDLRSGETVSRHGDVAVPAASTRKVAILMTCLAQVAEGRLDLERRLVIEARHQRNDSGCVRFLRPDLALTLHDALTLMMIVSDNSCTAAIMELIDLDAVNRFSRAAGMTRTRHVASAPASSGLTDPTPADLTDVNSTTADDMCRLLVGIVRGAADESAAAQLGSTPALCRLALDIMAGQQFRCGLPSLLPTSTKVAHKTGAGPSNESDVGVVYRGGEPLFAIAVHTRHIPVQLTDGRPGRALARAHIGALAVACWAAL
jgi:beta-lactamase class A